MKHFRTYATWGLAVIALLLSPIVVIFGIPLAIGIGLDILDLAGKGPVALALSAPVAFVLLYRLTPWARVHQFATALLRHSLDRATELHQAPKSIS